MHIIARFSKLDMNMVGKGHQKLPVTVYVVPVGYD